jgi:hypothetical protein
MTLQRAAATSPLPQLEGPVKIKTPGPLKETLSTLILYSNSSADRVEVIFFLINLEFEYGFFSTVLKYFEAVVVQKDLARTKALSMCCDTH